MFYYQGNNSDYYAKPANNEVHVQVTDDKIIYNLDAGEYEIDCCLLSLNRDVVIKGCGKKSGSNSPEYTKLIVKKEITLNDSNNQNDNAVLNFRGNENHPISVEISDLAIEIQITQEEADAANKFITSNETQIIKCHHVKSLEISNVAISTRNIETSCVEVRRGTNVAITNCNFINYNRRKKGHGIVLNGEINNVLIEHNDFIKYGGGGIISLKGVNSFDGVNISQQINKKNIKIRYNNFYCQNENGSRDENDSCFIGENSGKWSGAIDRVVNIYTNQEENKVLYQNTNQLVQSDVPCQQIVMGVHLLNNNFYINAPILHLFTIAFDRYTTFKDVSIRNNIIQYGSWSFDGYNDPTSGNHITRELIDFCLYYDFMYETTLPGAYDLTSKEPFHITGNTITCGSNVKNPITGNNGQYMADNHICVHMRGTRVLFNENLILCSKGEYSGDENTTAHKGIELFHVSKKGGEIVFCDNHCEGLKFIAHITSSSIGDIPMARLTGLRNYIQGDTRIVFNNVVESHVKFVDNDIISDYPIIFLNGFANSGTATFVANHVYRVLSRVTNYSIPYANIYYSTSCVVNEASLICCDNIFDGIDNTPMYSFVPSTMQVIHSKNIYSEFID